MGVYLLALLLLVRPLGGYMARVYANEPAGPNRWLKAGEQWNYRLAGVDSNRDMNWRQYAVAMLLLNLLGITAI